MERAQAVTQRRYDILNALYPLPRCYYYCAWVWYVLLAIGFSLMILMYGVEFDVQPKVERTTSLIASVTSTCSNGFEYDIPLQNRINNSSIPFLSLSFFFNIIWQIYRLHFVCHG